MLKIIESECTCDKCVETCKRCPCLPTPKEATALIKAGYGDRLSFREKYDDYDDDDSVSVLSMGTTEIKCGEVWNGTCDFLTKDNLCELHNTELKPLEARGVRSDDCGKSTPDLHEQVIHLWNSTKGKKVYRNWRKEYT